MKRDLTRPIGLLLVLALVVPVPAAHARRYRGTCSNALAGTQNRIRFVGRSDGDAGVVTGRIRGARCKVHGPVAVTCGALQSGSRQCSGTAPRGCTLSGFAYGGNFQGQYQCGTTVGALCWGSTCG